MKFLIISTLLLSSCIDAEPISSRSVQNFNINSYLGKWYEIARTDNRFEKNCTNVTADYSLRTDGGLNVTNKCFVKNKEKIAVGKAYFKDKKNVGALMVTFFWPFYGNYNIIYIDDDYQYAVVDGASKDYLWILARKPKMDEKTLMMLLEKVEQNGFKSDSLIYTKHYE